MRQKMFSFLKEWNQNLQLVKVLLWALIFSGFILLLDIYDIPRSAINKIPAEAMVILIGLFAVVFILIIYNGQFLGLCKYSQVNTIDIAALCGMCVSVICALAWGFWIDQHTYKWSIALGLCVLLLAFFVGRLLYIKKAMSKNKSHDQIYDLSAIRNGNVGIHPQDRILVSEKSVDYDLLNRRGIINELYRSIITCNSDSAFVIGLEGEWGSGKSTIINNVKKQLEKDEKIIVIDSFDPWIYGTQSALLMAMYDSILRETGVRYSVHQEKRVIKSLSSLLVDRYSAGSVMKDLLFSHHGDYEEAKEIIARLKKYVKGINERIVFIVDNMDRAEGNNIIFLLKLIGTVFDIPNIIYILSYDRDRINEIFKDIKQINPKYLEKIINQEIKVPLLQKVPSKKLYKECINNILKAYGMGEEEILAYQPITEVILANVKDLRVFKRMINSVFASVFCQENYLYRRDLLGLEVIRFIQPELYFEIQKNRAFFISQDRMADRHLYYERIDSKKFNSDGKAFFEKLFDQYGKFKSLLMQMFPFVKLFDDVADLLREDGNPNTNYEDISRNKRICSGKYFDLYFSYGSYEYKEVDKEISHLIDEIKAREGNNRLYDHLCNKIENIPRHSQWEWFEQLENNLNNLTLVPDEKKMLLAESIFFCLNSMDSSRVFWGMDTQSRALRCIELLLEQIEIKIKINAVQKFADKIIVEYDKLYMIYQLLYCFQNTRSSNLDNVRSIEAILKERFSDMCEKVIKEKINIYADPYYVQYNMWGLIGYLEIKENKEEIVQDYIAQIINEENIFRVMGDMISPSLGKGYVYKISDDNFRIFFKDTSPLDTLLENVDPKTSSEEFVLRVYEKFKSYENNSKGNNEIVS